MSHACPDCGEFHGAEVVEAVDMEAVTEVTEASVRVAEIEAERDVTLARISSRTETEIAEGWNETRIAELEGRLAGMAETLAALQPPEPEPVPVVIEEPATEPAIEEPAVAPPPVVEPAPSGKRKSNAWW